MENAHKEERIVLLIGNQSSGNVAVRLRTQDGRVGLMYCDPDILAKNCKYFADRLSQNWPTREIQDSRDFLDVNCQDSDFNHYVNIIRSFDKVNDDRWPDDFGRDVKNNLGLLQVAVELGCPQIVAACVCHLEAMPWEESEEKEILEIVPRMGLQAKPILARLQPVNEVTIRKIFLLALRFVTLSPPPAMGEVKASLQEQLNYILTKDDDAPLLVADDEIKLELKKHVAGLFSGFNHSLTESLSEAGNLLLFRSYMTDFSWVCEILSKMDIMQYLVELWFNASEKMIKLFEQESSTSEVIEIKLRAIEVTSKVIESIAGRTVVLPTVKCLQVLKMWLPFVRVTKPMIDSVMMNSENAELPKMNGEMWQSLETSFVSIVLALPSEDQTVFLTEWLQNEHIRYPDLTGAFEVWCYRSKVARRRLSLLEEDHVVAHPV